ncbi:viroplasmin family protein [Proteiniphilum acetatigenes]|uniref:ribonuclease H1 domain-containing protein n=1 Tax=Proteiniphilum acetatigenes TaxID=294710 RepID=UPI00039EA797|nr:viroplasmin family protein [Proteiniphilum acetatigenes]SFK29240.1 ribonuclease HI [Porphyromonadaceae bacterium KH3CP3RA]
MAKKKFYVVWKGVKPGIYNSWDDCKAQVSGFENALYKSFSTLEEAEKAFSGNPWKSLQPQQRKKPASGTASKPVEKFFPESIAVDAACSGNPGLMEYRGVFVADRTEIFHMGPMAEGTNNIGEFLAIVHALALLKQKGSTIPIYSDSVNAIKWVKNKKCNTKLEQTTANRPIFDLIERAEAWLRSNSYPNPILKWETKLWGEIPADFGRK